MRTMQPTRFRKHGVTEGHTAWVATGNRARRGLVRKLTTTATVRCSMTVTSTRPAACAVKRCVRSGSLSARPRLWAAGGNNGEARRGKLNDRRWLGTSRASRRPPDLPDGTALLFRRSGEGRACRRRAVLGQLTGDDRSQVPPCFAPLLAHLERPVSRTTGATVRESDYTSMVDKDGVPRVIDMEAVRRKLRSITKQNRPG